MASNPPGACCYKGVTHEGKAKGEYIQIGDFEAYISYPEDKSTEKAILMYVIHLVLLPEEEVCAIDLQRLTS